MKEENMKDIILDGHKLLWHQDRVKDMLMGWKVAPITIDCALTTACSYKCVYCYGQLQKHEGYNLSKDTIMSFLDDAAEIGVKGMSFVSDGESAHSPHLYEAILRGKKNGMDMALGTNGFALKDERLEDILPALTYIRYNISSCKPKEYARIHGVDEKAFYKVVDTIKESVKIKKKRNLDVTIGLQMVLLPDYASEILPLAGFGRDIGADYLVIKHCSDDETGALGVPYSKYDGLVDILQEAENKSTENYVVKAKWSKILSGGKRNYDQCLAVPLMLQMSGSGLVAPCGFLFNDKYKDKFHIGNIAEKRFKDIWKSDRYWEVMDYLSSEKFNAHTDCGTLCLQHKANEFLWDLKQGKINLQPPTGKPPMHINFI